MIAGKALDVLMANRVMGWTKVINPPRPTDELWRGLVTGTDFEYVDEYLVGPDDHNQVWSEDTTWSPSTDMWAAWFVVEKMSDLYPTGGVHIRYLPLANQWMCQFGAGEGARADTAALAICLAALGALGIPPTMP